MKMSALTKLITAIVTFLSILVSTILGYFPATKQPVFGHPAEIIQKEIYDEGEFLMNKYDFVVATDGDDKWSGKLEKPNQSRTDGPLKTIERAKELVKHGGDMGTGNITVWIRGGTYYIDETIKFDSSDVSNVTYKAYPNEEVVVCGAKPLSGWSEEKVNGITAWTLKVNIDGDGDFNALYNDRTSLSRTRYPESGYLYVNAENPEDDLNPQDVDGLFRMSTSFDAKSGDIKNFYNLSDVNIRILHWWKDEIATIKSYDAQSEKVTISRPTSMTIRQGNKYFLENVFEALNKQGEWYFDRTDKKLYYIPFDGENINSTTLYAGKTEQIISVDGVNALNIEGLTFKNTEWNIPKNNKEMDESSQAGVDATAAVDVKNSNSINVVNCKFQNIGGGGVKFGVNVKDSSVKSCLFQNVGAQAVFVQGENVSLDDKNITKNITIKDNHIYKFGRTFFNSVGVLIVNANSCDVSNNEIHDGYYTAISVGWVWGYGYTVTDNNKICNNLIYDIGQGWLSDMGGIYTLGMQPNTVISGNVIHNVAADLKEGGYGGWGIYLDEGSSYITVKKNLVYDCGSQGFHQHYGKENVVTNNIFAMNRMGQVIVSRKENHNSLTLKNNIIVGSETAMYCNVEKNKFKDDRNLYWDYKFEKNVKSSDGGKLNKKGKFGKTLMKAKGYYEEATFEDPFFKSIKNFDFTLAENSPALSEIGFEPWNYNNAGTTIKIPLN